MIYYVILDGFQLIGFDSINLAKYKVVELYQSENLKCDIYFNSYTYNNVGIKRLTTNIIKFDVIINQFENDII